jgi:nitrilase
VFHKEEEKMERPRTVRVAVVQASPVLFDRERTMEKALGLISEAAEKGAKLVLFPEAYIPCYPRGLRFGFAIGSRTEGGRKDFQRFHDNCVAVPGPDVDRLARAAGEKGVYLAMGVNEKNGNELDGTLHCCVLFFGPDGSFLGRHRKLKPTGSERYIWGEDDGSTLTVVDTAYGKMGALICWENYMPLARAALYQKGVKLYLAPTADQRDEYQCTLRHIAIEGRCFVLACNQYVEKRMYPTDLHGYDELESQPEVMCRGGSCIIDPFGRYLAGPSFGGEEILLADLDLDAITRGKADLDVVGHYARPDIFELLVHERKPS